MNHGLILTGDYNAKLITARAHDILWKEESC